MTMKLVVGNSAIGFDSCEVEMKNAKLRLIKGTISGREAVMRKCISNYNKGEESYTTPAGDQLPVFLRGAQE